MINDVQLLVLSNGHGEDVIAVQILEQLQQLPNTPTLAALPIVGEGYAYKKLNIPIIGPVQSMPSGGFIYMDGQQLLKDVRGGLIQLTLAQYKTIRQWGKNGGKILAVGDIVPLLFAWLSGANYAFVGTAKSDYYLRDDTDWLPQTSKIERWLGSVYLPWERWLMSRPRCQAVFPRDSLTTKILQQYKIPAFDLGNPMMDGIEGSKKSEIGTQKYDLTILLLPGSRSPEAEGNWQTIIQAIAGIISAFSDCSLLFLAAITPSLKPQYFQDLLSSQGWNFAPREALSISLNDPQALTFTQKNASLLLTQNAYVDCLQLADIAIAMAGTATEQFVGLGKPVISLPGKGPQFTYAFAEAQTRLLGESVTLVCQPQAVAEVVKLILEDSDRLGKIAVNGRRRMGEAGAAKRIAQFLME